MRGSIDCFVLLLLPLILSAQSQEEKFTLREPVVVIRGYHQLSKEEFVVINSQDQAKKVFAKALSDDDYLQAPVVDYSCYSAVFICHPRTPGLKSLKFVSSKVSQTTLDICYSESCLDQIFIGLNDSVAEASFLLIIIPKWTGRVHICQQKNVDGNGDAFILKAQFPYP